MSSAEFFANIGDDISSSTDNSISVTSGEEQIEPTEAENEISLDEQMEQTQQEIVETERRIDNPNLSDEDRINAFKRKLELEEKLDEQQDKKDEKEGRIPIPKPMKIIMNEIFDKEYRFKNEENKEKSIRTAFEYAIKEEEYFQKAKNRRKNQLLAGNPNLTEAQLDILLQRDSAMLRERIQAHLKRRVTLDVKQHTTDIILSNPERFKKYINPNTGEVIDDILRKNLTGKILEERVYSNWKPQFVEPPTIPETTDQTQNTQEEETNQNTQQAQTDQTQNAQEEETNQNTQQTQTDQTQSTQEEETNQNTQQAQTDQRAPTRPEVIKKEPWYTRYIATISSAVGAGSISALGVKFAMGGGPAGGIAALCLIVGSATVAGVSFGVSKFSERKMRKLTEELNTTTEEAGTEELERKIQKLANIRKHADRTARFFGGFFMGGVFSAPGILASHFLFKGKDTTATTQPTGRTATREAQRTDQTTQRVVQQRPATTTQPTGRTATREAQRTTSQQQLTLLNGIRSKGVETEKLSSKNLGKLNQVMRAIGEGRVTTTDSLIETLATEFLAKNN
ncbi:MAG TPA: hypothetical protein VJY47_00520 [Candidatus Dojkabacteria bacterium]|nr:hypothetical protein [Candidatus Dojkabacteria bacterium]